MHSFFDVFGNSKKSTRNLEQFYIFAAKSRCLIFLLKPQIIEHPWTSGLEASWDNFWPLVVPRSFQKLFPYECCVIFVQLTGRKRWSKGCLLGNSENWKWYPNQWRQNRPQDPPKTVSRGDCVVKNIKHNENLIGKGEVSKTIESVKLASKQEHPIVTGGRYWPLSAGPL